MICLEKTSFCRLFVYVARLLHRGTIQVSIFKFCLQISRSLLKHRLKLNEYNPRLLTRNCYFAGKQNTCTHSCQDKAYRRMTDNFQLKHRETQHVFHSDLQDRNTYMTVI